MENTKPKSKLKKVLVIIGIIILVIAIGIFYSSEADISQNIPETQRRT